MLYSVEESTNDFLALVFSLLAISVNFRISGNFHLDIHLETVGDSIGFINQASIYFVDDDLRNTSPYESSGCLPFPTVGTTKQYFTLFPTIKESNLSWSKSVNFTYGSDEVSRFQTQPCKTSQAQGYCRRINLASTKMLVVENYKYSLGTLLSVIGSATMSIFSILGTLLKIMQKFRLKAKTIEPKRVWQPNPLED